MRASTSSLISSQVPEFVRADYPTFVAFVEAYYEYLDSNGVDLESLRDLDTTLDDFVKYFKKELAANMPADLQVDDRFLLEHIKNHYLAKGSQQSFKLLFKLLYNKNVELVYPGTQMLRASDGRWQQDTSLFIKVSSGSPTMIEGKFVDVIKPNTNASFKLLVNRRQDVEIEVDRIVQLSSDTYEIFIDRKYYGNLEVGDVIRYVDFSGTIVSTTSKVSIVSGGTGFKAGQLFEIKNGSGVRSTLKITRVNSVGTILACEFIKFGVGYQTDFTLSINSSQDYFATSTQPLLSTVLVNDKNITITETTNGMAEQGYISRYDYAYTFDNSNVQQIYMDGTYVGAALGTFTTQAISQIVSSVGKVAAVLKINLGPQANYPGYYTSNAGFLSDSIYIQDSKYYQAFSYVLKIDERLDSYKTAVRTMVHPAGTALFGEYQVSNYFNVGAALQSLIKILAVSLADLVLTSDTSIIFDISKALTESVLMSESPTFAISKALTDSINAPTDAVSAIDFGKALTDSVSSSESISKFDITKLLSDSTAPTDSTTLASSKALTESVTSSDSSSLLTTKYLIETLTGSDYGVVFKNPYSQGTYFDYTSTIYSDEVVQTF